MQQLSDAVSRYVAFFKSPFPSMPLQDLGEGRISRQVLCERLIKALTTRKADPEWAAMQPSPGSVEDILYYQPMLKALGKRR
jgi:hypothetical protein